MDRHFLNSYVELLIQTCHRRGIHAMGGMAAQIPIKNDPAPTSRRSIRFGRTNCARCTPATMAPGSRIPGLVPIAKEIFDAVHAHRTRSGALATRCSHRARPADRARRAHHRDGLRWNIDVGLQYLESWLRGIGLRAHLQPDGGRRHRRNLPRPGVAMGKASCPLQ